MIKLISLILGVLAVATLQGCGTPKTITNKTTDVVAAFETPVVVTQGKHNNGYVYGKSYYNILKRDGKHLEDGKEKSTK